MADVRLASERVVVAAPLSYAGSAGRIWNLTRISDVGWQKALLVGLALVLVATAWLVVTAWYLFFGLLLVPYRLIRRGSRKRKRQGLQHREMIAAVQGQQLQAGRVAQVTAQELASVPVAPQIAPGGTPPAPQLPAG
jgi:uncharacterized membrane-anchored protein